MPTVFLMLLLLLICSCGYFVLHPLGPFNFSSFDDPFISRPSLLQPMRRGEHNECPCELVDTIELENVKKNERNKNGKNIYINGPEMEYSRICYKL